LIKMQNVSKRFGDKLVLDDVNLEVPVGRIFGLLGPSGSGKTTIINILAKQIPACVGTSSVEAKPFEVGLMLDDDGLYERISVKHNLELFARIYGLDKTAAEQTLRGVGLFEERDKPVLKLSRGMKQRLALSRAIVHKPKVLFLDEPTANLDPNTARGIHGLILGLRERGTTVFLTTHNMQEAVNLCDEIALLYKGKIIESGTPEGVCQKYNSYKTIPDLESVFIRLTEQAAGGAV